MGDIAEEARLSRSLLYVYFEDMDDIVLAVTLRGLKSMRERFETAVTEHEMTKAIEQGIEDGSIRSELDPTQTAITLWGCTHGLIQLAANKGTSLEQQYGLSPDALFDDGLGFLGVALAGHPLDGAPDATGDEWGKVKKM